MCRDSGDQIGSADAHSEATDLIFTTAEGEPINEDRLASKEFKAIFQQAELHDHALRSSPHGSNDRDPSLQGRDVR